MDKRGIEALIVGTMMDKLDFEAALGLFGIVGLLFYIVLSVVQYLL